MSHPIQPDLILLRKLKFNGAVKSEWEGSLLPPPNEEWVLVLHHPHKHRKFANGRQTRADIFFIHCLNLSKPITVLLEYDLNGRFTGAKCDAALPASQNGSQVEFIDLDLDLIVKPDFSTFVRDQDTFATHRKTMSYSQKVIQLAFESITIAKELVQNRQFPFDQPQQLLKSAYL